MGNLHSLRSDIIDPNDPEVMEIVEDCYESLPVTAKVFFETRFNRVFTRLHHKIFDVVQNEGNQLVCIAAPRDLGKTSINNLLIPAWNILFQRKKYIVPVSATSTLAKQQSENLKRELMTNKLIRSIFGPIKSKKVNKSELDFDDQFNKDMWVTSTGTAVMPRGAGQQIRGQIWKDHRPDLIIVDDLEDPENIDSEEQRDKKKEWFWADLMNSVDIYGSGWRIIVVGTVLHQNSLIVDLLDHPDWHSVRLEICDDDYKSLIPEWVDDEWIQRKAQSYRDAGKIDTFYREYRNLPIAKEDAEFKQEYFRYYNVAKESIRVMNEDDQDKYLLLSDSEVQRDPYVENMIIVDVARTTKAHSTESAIVGVGVDLRHDRFYVRDIVHGKFHPDELYAEIIGMARRLNCHIVGVEVTGLHEFVVYPLKTAILQAGVYIDLIELNAKGGTNEKGKTQRVRSLVSFYRRGEVYHNKAVTQPLESQLEVFPKADKWDVMDAFGYLPQMLEKGERYFTPQLDDGEIYKNIEREYKDVMKDDYRGEKVNFRIA